MTTISRLNNRQIEAETKAFPINQKKKKTKTQQQKSLLNKLKYSICMESIGE